MKNKRKYLWILTLISFVWGTAAFNSYADDKGNNEKVVKKVVKSKNKEKAKKEKNEKEEVIVIKSLKKFTSSESKFYGKASFEGAYNVGVSYPARTDFTPSLIITKTGGEKALNVFTLDAAIRLGLEKKFFFDDEVVNSTVEFKATKEKVTLRKLFLATQEWTVGLTRNNFANIATFLPVGVIQVSWRKDINKMFTVGLGVEQAPEFNFFGKDAQGKLVQTTSSLKPRKDLPAGSARVQYNLPNELGCIELSGLIRPLGYFNGYNKGKTDFKLGYGLNLGSEIKIKPETDTLTANVILGAGIGEYVGDLSGVESEPISVYYDYKVGSDDGVKSIMASGVYVSYEHHWFPFLRSNFGGGLTTILNDYKIKHPDFYRLGGYLSGNLVYWFTEHTSVGVEYGAGFRNNADKSKQDSARAHHIKASLEFKI